MNSLKCANCGLSNFSTDLQCRRCHKLLFRPTDRIASEKPPRRNSLISLLIFAAVAGAGYYMYSGMTASMNQVSSTDANRAAAQPANKADEARSRAEADRQKSQRVGNFVGISSGLNAHSNRTQQTQQAMDQLSNSNER